MSFASSFKNKALTLCVLPLLQAYAFSSPCCYDEGETACNWEVSADFLYWFASEEVASIWADVIGFGVNSSSWEAPGFDFTWDFGLRIGLGTQFFCDGWDTKFHWTWYSTEATHALTSEPGGLLRPEFFAAFLSGDTPEKMRGNWRLCLNMFDWELGQKYCMGRCFSLRPFLGIKGGWIDQSIRVNYFDLTIDEIFPTHLTAKERLQNDFWGIGPLGGVNTDWRVWDCPKHFFHLFGDFSLAAMWGSWSCDDQYKNTIPKTSSVKTKDSSLGALMFQGLMGVGWEIDLSGGKSHFGVKLGYEMQLWLNQLRIATFQLQRLHNDLTLQGLTLSCRFAF